jgi:hypothetical protein
LGKPSPSAGTKRITHNATHKPNKARTLGKPVTKTMKANATVQTPASSSGRLLRNRRKPSQMPAAKNTTVTVAKAKKLFR